jgi:uncharacterized protein
LKRLPLAAAILAFDVFLLLEVSVRQAALFAVGIGLGAALAGARFGFTTGWRMLVEDKDPRGVTGQLVLLALASAAAMPLLAAFPELQAARGAPSYSLLIGAFLFGASMQLADGCGSGTLYKAGMGIPLNMGILPLFAIGSFFGSLHVLSWLQLGQTAPLSLVESQGSARALLLTLAGLGALAVAVRAWVGAGRRWFEAKWMRGAVLLAVFSTLNLLVAGQPWGVVYGFGLWAAKAALALGAFDPAANAFWSAPSNAQRLAETMLLDVTSITNIGILAGALWTGAREPARASTLSAKQWAAALAAGFVMGYSSRLALGCNVGAMLSGISTGSLHGWIWVPLAFAGTLVGVRVRRRLAY